MTTASTLTPFTFPTIKNTSHLQFIHLQRTERTQKESIESDKKQTKKQTIRRKYKTRNTHHNARQETNGNRRERVKPTYEKTRRTRALILNTSSAQICMCTYPRKCLTGLCDNFQQLHLSHFMSQAFLRFLITVEPNQNQAKQAELSTTKHLPARFTAAQTLAFI